MVFSSQLILHNVLCVPSFHLNLISIHSLVYHSLCLTIFLTNSCVIQDLRSENMIGTRTKREGLYNLYIPKRSTCSSIQKTPGPWHQHLGHPSNNVLNYLSSFVDSIQACDATKCLICPLVKQTHLPFSLCNTSSHGPFELLQVDIWGGCHITYISGARSFLTIF